jgi:hypothetical protein
MLFKSVILSGTSRREERGKVEGPRCSVLCHAASRHSHEDVSVELPDELPDAAWLQPALSGSFDSPAVRFAPSEFAQDDRVKKCCVWMKQTEGHNDRSSALICDHLQRMRLLVCDASPQLNAVPSNACVSSTDGSHHAAVRLYQPSPNNFADPVANCSLPRARYPTV